MDGVKVSVVVTCYNLGRYLDQAVESALKQTFQDLEVLIVDDGSTDEETRRLLEDYDKPRVQLVRTDHKGFAAARNLGLAHTSGAYVCMLDADDVLDPAFLDRSVTALDRDSSLSFVSHWVRAFGDEEWEWTPTFCKFPELLETNTVSGAALVRRSAVDAVGGFDEAMHVGSGAWDLWITLVERGFKGRVLPEVLFYYRRRADSMTRRLQGDGQRQAYRRLVEKHAQTYKKHFGSKQAGRERDTSARLPHARDLDLEYVRWLALDLTKARPDAAPAEPAAGEQTPGSTEDERVRAEKERTRNEEKLARLAETIEYTENERWLGETRFSEERVQLRAEIDRQSLALDVAGERIAKLESAAQRAREERDAQARALEAAKTQVLQLAAAANHARGEVQAVRNSMSWQVTAPLRAVYGSLRQLFVRRR